MKASLQTLVLFFAATTLALPLRAQRPVGISTLHVFVDVPGEPGTKVTLRYLAGPDSLRGKSQEFAVPADFSLPGQPLTLLAERTNGHGRVRLRVEEPGRDLEGEGTADRVRIEVSQRGVRVRVSPWWLPI